eukprot:3066913-Rhodomonas_salina.2
MHAQSRTAITPDETPIPGTCSRRVQNPGEPGGKGKYQLGREKKLSRTSSNRGAPILLAFSESLVREWRSAVRHFYKTGERVIELAWKLATWICTRAHFTDRHHRL